MRKRLVKFVHLCKLLENILGFQVSRCWQNILVYLWIQGKPRTKGLFGPHGNIFGLLMRPKSQRRCQRFLLETFLKFEVSRLPWTSQNINQKVPGYIGKRFSWKTIWDLRSQGFIEPPKTIFSASSYGQVSGLSSVDLRVVSNRSTRK